VSGTAGFSLRAALTAGALALLATAALAITSPASAMACGSRGYQTVTSYGWSDGGIYVSGYYVYSSGRPCPEEYLDQELPPEEPPPPSACDLDPDSRACTRQTVDEQVRAALRLPGCAALVGSPSSPNAAALFSSLENRGRILDGGVPTGDRAGAVASSPQGYGENGNIMLWDRFYATRPELFPFDAGTQHERRANIVIEELMHLSGAMPANHAANGQAENWNYWSARIRQACQPGIPQNGVAGALAGTTRH